MEFGTGCLKVTPAHDANDYLIAERHQLPSINIFDESGCLNKDAQLLVGEDRFTARVSIIKLLKEQGYLRDQQSIRHSLSFSERTHVVVEPRLSLEWFCSMKKLAEPALEVVERNGIRFFPAHQKNTYRNWMTQIRDWCISRQLWWGHRIPVWYTNQAQTEYVVAESQEKAIEACKKAGISCPPSTLTQEPRVLDTWFSSWLWPISVFDGIRAPKSRAMSYFYPTDDLVTGPDILFFWVARMIMAGYAFTGKQPFKNVYFTGIVRDAQRRKMSKSLGNSPDPIHLIDQYGADSVRIAMMMCGKAGGDLLFDESICRQGRDFANKVWNTLRLVKKWKELPPMSSTSERAQRASAYFYAEMQQLLQWTEQQYEEFRISEVAVTLYKFIREDFSNTYLELLKPSAETGLSEEVIEEAVRFFEQLLALLHPFMPFLSEEVWQQLRDRSAHESLMIASYPKAKSYDQKLIEESNYLKELLSSIRRSIERYGWKKGPATILEADAASPNFRQTYGPFLEHVFQIREIELKKRESFEHQDQVFLVHTDAFALRATAQELEQPSKPNMDFIRREVEQTQRSIDRLLSFHQQITQRLSSEKFITYAKPELIERERKKQSDTLKKIHLQLSKLRHSIDTDEMKERELNNLRAYLNQIEDYIGRAEGKSQDSL